MSISKSQLMRTEAQRKKPIAEKRGRGPRKGTSTTIHLKGDDLVSKKDFDLLEKAGRTRAAERVTHRKAQRKSQQRGR